VGLLCDTHLPDRINTSTSLLDQHNNLVQLRDNLFGFVTFRGHFQSSFYSLLGWTNSMEKGQSHVRHSHTGYDTLRYERYDKDAARFFGVGGINSASKTGDAGAGLCAEIAAVAMVQLSEFRASITNCAFSHIQLATR